MFQGEERAEALGVPFMYGVVEFLLIGMYVLGAWKAGWTKAPPSDPFYKVVTCSYEVLLAEKLDAENDSTEVNDYDDCSVEVTDQYHNADLGVVDPYSPTKDAKEEPKGESPTKAGDDLSITDRFWKSLGYEVSSIV